MNDVLYAVEDGVATATINRVERKNALTLEMMDGLADYVQWCQTQSDVRCLVITGSGDSFCSGADLSVLASDTEAEAPTAFDRKGRLTNSLHRLHLAIKDLDIPVIAAVNGSAVGAGMDLALMCDIRIAGTSARFSEAYVRMGIVPGAGGFYLLPQIVGMSKALELLLTGDFVDSGEAYRIGMVNRLVPDAELEGATSELAHKFASSAPIAMGMIKRATYQSRSMELRAALDMISSHLGEVLSTEDSREAIAAFREKRTPTFVGR